MFIAANRLSHLPSALSHLRRPVQAAGSPDDLPLPGGEGSPAGHPVQVRRVLGLRPEDREVRGSQGTVQGTHSLPGPRDAQHLSRLPHLRVHGQQIEEHQSIRHSTLYVTK